jgi:hypothetical protein
MEGRKRKMMGDRARGRRLHARATASFIALQCSSQGGKAVGLSLDAPSTSRGMATVSKTDPTIVEGPTNTQGSKVKPVRWVRAA